MVAPDGSLYMQVENANESETDTCAGQNLTVSYSGGEQLALLHILANGATSSQGLESNTASSSAPANSATTGEVIPDGNGGVLANWTYQNAANIADAGTQGIVSSVFTVLSGSGTDTMVLGDNNIAFITDGRNLVSFSAANLLSNWTYTSTGGLLSFIDATPGSGVLINDSQQGAIQLDASGTPSSPVASLQGAVPFDMADWEGIVDGELAPLWEPDGSNGITNALAASDAPAPGENVQGQKQPSSCSPNTLNCVLAPIANVYPSKSPYIERDVTYGVYSLKSGNLTPLYQHSGKAFRITVHEDPTPEGLGVEPGATICNKNYNVPANVCVNTQGEYEQGIYTDKYSTQGGKPVDVLQKFKVDRQQVEVFWPTNQYSGQTSWYGATIQRAITTGTAVRIFQMSPDTKHPATCTANKSATPGCDTTPAD
jgi:hypothetical protein